MQKLCKLGKPLLSRHVYTDRIRSTCWVPTSRYFATQKKILIEKDQIDYSEENWELIQEYLGMTYRQLQAVIRKLKTKPKTRSHEGILQFLVETVPTKESESESESELVSGSDSDSQEYSKADATNIKEFAHYLNTGYQQTLTEIQDGIANSAVLSHLPLHTYDKLHLRFNTEDSWSIPHIETMPKHLIEKRLLQMKHLSARRELEVFLTRSSLSCIPSIVLKSKRIEKKAVNVEYYNLVLWEQEYNALHKTPVSKLLETLNAKQLSPLSALEYLRYVSRAVNKRLFIHYVKKSEKKLLKPLWTTIIGALDRKYVVSSA